MKGERAASAAPPLAVDLDGSLLRTDMLMEGLAHGLTRRPLATLAALGALGQGRPRLKARVAEIAADLNIDTLPRNEALLAWLRGQHALGRPLVLATASDRRAAEAVAKRIGVFEAVLASDGRSNLKGARKAQALAQRWPQGFAYAGDSFADVQVWAQARGVVFVGWKRRALEQALAAGGVLEAAFPTPAPRLRDWAGVLGLPFWALNLLVLAPALLPGVQTDALRLSEAFLAAGFASSAAALWRALAALEADRAAGTGGPLAEGRLPLAHALGALAACAALTLAAGAMASGPALAAAVLLGLVLSRRGAGPPAASFAITAALRLALGALAQAG